MPLIVFDYKGIPATRRERIEVAVEAGGRHVKEQYEGWIALDAILGVILLLGAGLGLAHRRFPLYVMLLIPPLIRVFMLRPVQRELYYVALVVGVYTDLVFAIDAAGGVFFVRRARGAKRLCHFRRFTSQ